MLPEKNIRNFQPASQTRHNPHPRGTEYSRKEAVVLGSGINSHMEKYLTK